MAYTVNQQLIDRVGTEVAARLTTDSGGVPDDDKVTAARAGAEGEVNAYLAPRWQTPVDLSVNAETSQAITRMVLDLGEYALKSLRQPVDEGSVRLRTDAIKFLKDLRDGTAALPGLVALASPTSQGTGAEVSGSTRIFSRGSMDGF
ncbi:MAG TPA: DUF1320 domain-containing protein [Rhodospirillales bacterium]|nr:DUF1320 domain-containing protein [Rhodospirillales bacterium]